MQCKVALAGILDVTWLWPHNDKATFFPEYSRLGFNDQNGPKRIENAPEIDVFKIFSEMKLEELQ